MAFLEVFLQDAAAEAELNAMRGGPPNSFGGGRHPSEVERLAQGNHQHHSGSASNLGSLTHMNSAGSFPRSDSQQGPAGLPMDDDSPTRHQQQRLSGRSDHPEEFNGRGGEHYDGFAGGGRNGLKRPASAAGGDGSGEDEDPSGRSRGRYDDPYNSSGSRNYYGGGPPGPSGGVDYGPTSGSGGVVGHGGYDEVHGYGNGPAEDGYSGGERYGYPPPPYPLSQPPAGGYYRGAGPQYGPPPHGGGGVPGGGSGGGGYYGGGGGGGSMYEHPLAHPGAYEDPPPPGHGGSPYYPPRMPQQQQPPLPHHHHLHAAYPPGGGSGGGGSLMEDLEDRPPGAPPPPVQPFSEGMRRATSSELLQRVTSHELLSQAIERTQGRGGGGGSGGGGAGGGLSGNVAPGGNAEEEAAAAEKAAAAAAALAVAAYSERVAAEDLSRAAESKRAMERAAAFAKGAEGALAAHTQGQEHDALDTAVRVRKTTKCAFCVEGDVDTQLRPCGHLFHGRCLKPWLQASAGPPCCLQCSTLISSCVLVITSDVILHGDGVNPPGPPPGPPPGQPPSFTASSPASNAAPAADGSSGSVERSHDGGGSGTSSDRAGGSDGSSSSSLSGASGGGMAPVIQRSSSAALFAAAAAAEAADLQAANAERAARALAAQAMASGSEAPESSSRQGGGGNNNNDDNGDASNGAPTFDDNSQGFDGGTLGGSSSRSSNTAIEKANEDFMEGSRVGLAIAAGSHGDYDDEDDDEAVRTHNSVCRLAFNTTNFAYLSLTFLVLVSVSNAFRVLQRWTASSSQRSFVAEYKRFMSTMAVW